MGWFKRFHSWRKSATEGCIQITFALRIIVWVLSLWFTLSHEASWMIMASIARILHYTHWSPICHVFAFLRPDQSEWSACIQLHARETDLRRSCLYRSLLLTVKYVQLGGNREVHSHWGRSWKQSQMPEVHPLDVMVWMTGLGWVVAILVDMNAASDLKLKKEKITG